MKKNSINIFVLFFLVNLLQAQNTIIYNCILRSNAQMDTMCDGKVIPIFGITNSLGATAKIPAKILYCNEGDSMVLNTKSISQNDHHTIHLHGLDVDTRNDGDPSTSFWLSHLQDTTYSFRAKNAGTYIYHCHAADVVHVQMGMYGLIVVRAQGGTKNAWTGGPAYDKDYKWLTSEVDSVWHFHQPIHDTLMDTINIPKYIPNYFLINGKCGSEISNDDSIKINGAQGEKIFVRIGNIGYLSNRIIFPPWLNAQILDSDGRPLPNAIVNDTSFIMPGERFGIMLQSNIQASGSIKVEYIDMNTGSTVSTAQVPVNIVDFIGITENSRSKNNMLIYPNPVSDLLKLNTPNNGEIEIINVLGNVVLKCRAQKEIDVSAFTPGIYFLKLKTGSNSILSGKFIKQ